MTTTEIKASLELLRAIADTIKELGECPAGTIYAAMCGTVSLPTFTKAIETLSRAKLIERNGNMLRWICKEVTQDNVNAR